MIEVPVVFHRQDTVTNCSSSYQDQQQCPLAQSDGMYGGRLFYYLRICRSMYLSQDPNIL